MFFCFIELVLFVIKVVVCYKIYSDDDDEEEKYEKVSKKGNCVFDINYNKI